jgi:hypothetical protein
LWITHPSPPHWTSVPPPMCPRPYGGGLIPPHPEIWIDNPAPSPSGMEWNGMAGLGLSPSVLGGGPPKLTTPYCGPPRCPLVRGNPLVIKWNILRPGILPLYWRRVQCQHWVQCQVPNSGLEKIWTPKSVPLKQGYQTICLYGQTHNIYVPLPLIVTMKLTLPLFCSFIAFPRCYFQN